MSRLLVSSASAIHRFGRAGLARKPCSSFASWSRSANRAAADASNQESLSPSASPSLPAGTGRPSTSAAAQSISRTPGAIFQELKTVETLEQVHSLIESFKSLETMTGSVNFIESTLRKLDELDVEVQKVTYDKLLDVFPKGHQITRSWLDVMWPRATPQVDCALNVLQRMEDADIPPDLETFKPLFYAFGKDSEPVRKCEAMYSWNKYFGKLPSQRPPPLPEDKTLRAKYALERLLDQPGARVLRQGSSSAPFLVYHSTPKQRELLRTTYLSSSLLVHGPFSNWYRRTFQPYYVLSLPEDESVVLGYCMAELHTQEFLDVWITELGDFKGNIVFRFTDLLPDVSRLYSKRQRRHLFGQAPRLPSDDEMKWVEISGARLIAGEAPEAHEERRSST